ncbi:MAG: DUF1592 domain-containing protein [Bryobacteraceae bacterium]
MKSVVKVSCWLAMCTMFFVSSDGLRAQDSFQRDLRPLVKQYCLGCHSTALHTGDLDLERFTSMADVAKHPKVWQTVIDQLTLGEMPPKGMPQPGAEQRSHMLASVRDALRQAAQGRAGDPGPVVLRRLNNAEYTFTVRDLTGVRTLEPAKEFPVDGAAGEGFTNTGNSLVMSPALFGKYLDSAKRIASHAVLLPDGLRFSPTTSRSDWTNETLSEIRAIYNRYTESGGAETVTQQGMELDKNRGGILPLRKYLSASLDVRRGQSVNSAAARQGLSPKYLAFLVQLMRGTKPSPLLDDLRRRWRAAGPADVPALQETIEQWQQTLWKFSSVGHIGKVDGPKAWMEPVTPLVRQQEFKTKLAVSPGNAAKLYLVTGNAGDGAAGDAVIWQEPRLTIPGRPPVLLRDVRALAGVLGQKRQQIISSTAPALNAAAGIETGGPVDSIAKKAWFDYLGLTDGIALNLVHLNSKIEKTGPYAFVQGWGGGKEPALYANSTDQPVRIPGNMKGRGVAVLPTPTDYAAVGWRCPIAGSIRIEATVKHAHVECGNGITWSLELRSGGTRQRLAEGLSNRTAATEVGPLERVSVKPGDLVSLLIGPREGNSSCDLTDLELHLSGNGQDWSLTRDVSGSVLAANPHADSAGHAGIWHFYGEPVAGAGSGTVIPRGSLLARWQSSDNPAEKRQLAAALQKLLTSPAPAEDTPDRALFRQLTSLAGPLFATASVDVTGGGASSSWGIDPASFDGPNLRTKAPSVIEVTLPADLVADSEFSVTGSLDPVAGAEGSVQLQVLTEKPELQSGLQPAHTMIRTASGTWTSNNQRVSYAMPVVVNDGSAARKRIEAEFEEFRQAFPASLCYTKIVPVDEVVTLTLFHREDNQLARLVLNDVEKARLDRLWDQLMFISQAPLKQVDVFEQLWQYATQDADPSKFEPLRQPIKDRAAAFRRQMLAAEPKHLDAVIDFADKAYRRPITVAEKQELRGLYQKLRSQELPHEEAIRLTLARVLAGPAFLYRTEKAAPGANPAPVSDWELASRLSYFLWSSEPDAELRAAAAAGKLRTPEGIAVQAKRMLQDDRVRRMATEFGAAWLHIYDFDTLDEKSERHFPTFAGLRGDMYEESVQFFTDFFRNNRPVLSLLDADYTFLDERLARHYGIDGVTGPEWRRVDGMKAHSRGGVLGQAAILSKQSGASRTSPILRGNWVAEVLLGDKLPRPPKDVPQLPEDEANLTLTMREMTEKHTSDARCASCHKRIDPYGYSLEAFDAIGRFREKDLGGRPINTKTKVMDGTEMDGLEGLRQYLLTKGRDAFVRQFCRKLLGYGLGRAVQLSDEPVLDQMQKQILAANSQVGSVIEMIVGSRQFREIRGRDAATEE